MQWSVGWEDSSTSSESCVSVQTDRTEQREVRRKLHFSHSKNEVAKLQRQSLYDHVPPRQCWTVRCYARSRAACYWSEQTGVSRQRRMPCGVRLLRFNNGIPSTLHRQPVTSVSSTFLSAYPDKLCTITSNTSNFYHSMNTCFGSKQLKRPHLEPEDTFPIDRSGFTTGSYAMLPREIIQHTKSFFGKYFMFI